MQEPLSLATVHGVLILDNDGKRIQCKVYTYMSSNGETGGAIYYISKSHYIPHSQYYSDAFPSLKEQLKFEESLFRKTHKANGMWRVS